jgi:hypothetical protein
VFRAAVITECIIFRDISRHAEILLSFAWLFPQVRTRYHTVIYNTSICRVLAVCLLPSTVMVIGAPFAAQFIKLLGISESARLGYYNLVRKPLKFCTLRQI